MPATDVGRTGAKKESRAAAAEGISLPLYAGGLVVTLSGVLTVTAAVTTTNAPMLGTAVTGVAVMLTLLGYAFSLACRQLSVPSRMIEVGYVAFLLYIIARLAVHDPKMNWFLNGASVPDTRLAVGLMWLAVSRSWTLISDDLVMSSCVFAAAMIGLVGTQDVNTVTVVYFCCFVLAMVFLLIHQNYLQNRLQAAPAERAVSATSLLPAQVGLTALCGLVVLALGMALVTPAKALLANVSLAQAIRGLVGTDHALAADVPGGGERFSDGASLEIGQGSVWPTTSDVLLHVVPSDGAPHYWRGRTYDQYSGTGWQSTLSHDRLPLTRRAGTPRGAAYPIPTSLMIGEGETPRRSVGRRSLVSSFEVRGDTDQFYYADEPTGLTDESGDDQGLAGLHSSIDGRIDLNGRPVRSAYEVTSLPPPDASIPAVQARLRRDGTADPLDVRQFYLPLLIEDQNTVTTPADILCYRRIVAEALAGLPAGRRTRYDKAVAIRDWIAGHCTYSLDVEATPDDVDHVRYFLQQSRRGYCDLFASSMVVLCRAAGIPARLATGFAPGDRDDTGFNLRAMDKHAWAEVYFPGDRWQVFDATVDTRTDGTIPTVRSDTLGLWARGWKALKSSPLTALLAVAMLLAIAYIVKTELVDRFLAPRHLRARTLPRSRGAPQAADPMQQGYGALTRSLARLGLPRRPAETPAEYERRALSFLSAQEAALGVSLRPAPVSAVTARFLAARYSDTPPGEDPALDRDLRAFVAAAARARRVQFWRRLRPVKKTGVQAAR